MISISDLQAFFARYSKNFDQEKKINNASLSSANVDTWLDSLGKKSRLLQELYKDNERLLDKYLRPVLNGEEPCTDEIAEELLDIAVHYYDDGDMNDDLAVAETLIFLERYFEKNGDKDRQIKALHYLGHYYNMLFDPKEGKISAECFDKIRSMKDYYFVTEDNNTRVRIADSFYNYALVCGNWMLVPHSEMIKDYDAACEFMDDPAVIELYEDKERLKRIRHELDYDILGNPIQAVDSIEPVFLAKALPVLKQLYKEQLEINPDPFAMPDEIYLNYLTAMNIAGEMSREEYILSYKEYCDRILDDPKEAEKDEEEFISSRLFQVYMSHLGWLIHLLKDDACPLENKEELRRNYMQRFVRYVSGIPKDEHSGFANGIILYSLQEMLSNSDDPMLDVNFILNVTVCRDVKLLLDSLISKKLAVTIVDNMLKSSPELLVGVLGTQNILDVLEKSADILNFFSDAAQIYNIGKMYMPQIIGKHTRPRTAREWRIYHRYPLRGWEPFSKSDRMLPFKDIITGHKKSWDGESGFPEEFDIVSSPDRRAISIISICDRLNETATPISAENFRTQSFDNVLNEIINGGGTLYDPEIARWLSENSTLCNQLDTICTSGITKICYDAYRDFISGIAVSSTNVDDIYNSGKKNDSSPINWHMMNMLSRSTLMMMQVHLPDGNFRILYRRSSEYFSEDEGNCINYLSGLRHMIHPDDLRNVYQHLEPGSLGMKMSTNHGEAELEFRRKDRLDTWRWTRMQCSLIEEESGRNKEVLILFRDIDESRRKTEQVREAMQAAYRNAEAANLEKSRFLSSMSHDIRTPMNVIIGMTRLAIKHADEPERLMDYLHKIDDTSHHLLELINQVLDMSKIESGSLILNSQPVNLNQVISLMAEEASTLAKDHRHSFTVESSTLRNANVLTDQVRLTQVLQNILSNAVKYTPDGGKIEFIVEELNSNRNGYGLYSFTIRDNGIGMSEEFQQNLFKPFQREETHLTGNVTGTGLGMSIISQVINAMAGNIEVKSKQGEGTEVKVILSFAIDYEARRAEETTENSDRIPDLHGRHILLAEDNPLNREIACEILMEMGAQITTAEDGLEALETFERAPADTFDLIFMDIQMPRMNGYETSRAIRALNREDAKVIPIVAMTADAFAQDVTKAMQSGMNAHLSKPIELKKLYHVLNTIFM
ncbi:MAG: response regulator [Clostridia bacterium]|nr:response regulator [Clostridia bacterium]